MFDPSFFKNLSVLCANLAPVAGPFLESSGNVARAIDNAQVQIAELSLQNRQLEAQLAALPQGSYQQQCRELLEHD